MNKFTKDVTLRTSLAVSHNFFLVNRRSIYAKFTSFVSSALYNGNIKYFPIVSRWEIADDSDVKCIRSRKTEKAERNPYNFSELDAMLAASTQFRENEWNFFRKLAANDMRNWPSHNTSMIHVKRWIESCSTLKLSFIETHIFFTFSSGLLGSPEDSVRRVVVSLHNEISFRLFQFPSNQCEHSGLTRIVLSAMDTSRMPKRENVDVVATTRRCIRRPIRPSRSY